MFYLYRLYCHRTRTVFYVSILLFYSCYFNTVYSLVQLMVARWSGDSGATSKQGPQGTVMDKRLLYGHVCTLYVATGRKRQSGNCTGLGKQAKGDRHKLVQVIFCRGFQKGFPYEGRSCWRVSRQVSCRGEYNNLAETGLQSWSIYTAADEADKGVERLRAPPKGLYKTSTFPRLRDLKTYTVHCQTMAILPTQRPSTGRVHDSTTWDLLKSVMREPQMRNLLRFLPFQLTRSVRGDIKGL